MKIAGRDIKICKSDNVIGRKQEGLETTNDEGERMKYKYRIPGEHKENKNHVYRRLL